MDWFKVLGNEALTFPFVKKVKAGNRSVCLVGYEGQIYALAVKCPHAGADISMGWCAEKKLVCPYHRYSYDVATGRGSEGQGDYITTYAVEERVDGVFVGISSNWNFLSKLYKK